MAKTYVKIDTRNLKLRTQNPVSGRVISSTSRTSDTCAPDCPFLDKGQHNDAEGVPICYANEKLGRPSIFQHAEKYGIEGTASALEKIQYGAPKGSAVRHLVSGDVAGSNDDYIKHANALHAARQDLQGWGYTHNWRRMKPTDVKGWTLNASTETKEQAEEALRQGWQAVIESPEGSELAGTRIGGRRVVSCPNQATHGKVGCADCMLCRQDTATRPIVEFKIHGQKKKAVSNIVKKARNLTEHFKTGFTDRGEQQ